jgi:hypothetical protein
MIILLRWDVLNVILMMDTSRSSISVLLTFVLSKMLTMTVLVLLLLLLT